MIMAIVASGKELTTIVLNEEELEALATIVSEAIARTNEYDVLWELSEAICVKG